MSAGEWLVLLIYLWACAMPAALGVFWMLLGAPAVAESYHERHRERMEP